MKFEIKYPDTKNPYILRTLNFEGQAAIGF